MDFALGRSGRAAITEINRAFSNLTLADLVHRLKSSTACVDQAKRRRKDLATLRQLPNESGSSYVRRFKICRDRLLEVAEVSNAKLLEQLEDSLNGVYSGEMRDALNEDWGIIGRLPMNERLLAAFGRIQAISADRELANCGERGYSFLGKGFKAPINSVEPGQSAVKP